MLEQSPEMSPEQEIVSVEGIHRAAEPLAKQGDVFYLITYRFISHSLSFFPPCVYMFICMSIIVFRNVKFSSLCFL